METVTVFVYILVAVLLAPAIWFVWFGLDELLDRAGSRHAVYRP